MGEPKDIIACFYDCDETLVPGYSPEVIFEHYGLDPNDVWNVAKERRRVAESQGINLDFEQAYLNLILEYVERGVFHDLNNQKLRELGKDVPVFPGLPEFFTRTKRYVERKDPNITVEHYIISTGIKEIIKGCRLNNEDLTDIFAAEFIERDGKLKYVARTIGHLKKTEFMFVVSKGCNFDDRIDVNQRVSKALRRVPFENMIYVGDGLTDVPCWSLMEDRNGDGIVVYAPKSLIAQRKAELIYKDEKRVKKIAPADYSCGSDLDNIFREILDQKMIGIWESRR